MDLKLTKKIALVTGSTAGIGNAIAASLAREGATVIVNGRSQAAVEGAVAAMKAEAKGDVMTSAWHRWRRPWCANIRSSIFW